MSNSNSFKSGLMKYEAPRLVKLSPDENLVDGVPTGDCEYPGTVPAGFCIPNWSHPRANNKRCIRG